VIVSGIRDDFMCRLGMSGYSVTFEPKNGHSEIGIHSSFWLTV